VFAGEKAEKSVFRDLTTLMTQGAVLGGSAKAGKRARVLVSRKAGLMLLDSSAKDKDAAPTEQRVREPTEAAALGGDWVFVREKEQLTVQRAPGAGGAPEKITELGAMPEAISKKAEDRVVTCRAGTTEVTRLRGAENDFVTLGAGGEWSAPQKVRATDQLSCAEGVATMATTTHNDVGGRVHATVRVTRCTSAECKESQLSHYDMVGGNADFLPAARGELAVAIAGSRIFFAWFTSLGDLRVRSGAFDTVAQAADVVLEVGGEEQGGTTLREVALVPSTTGTLLLARTGDGVRLFAFGQDGTVAPAVTSF
jgi:hypothetical protein